MNEDVVELLVRLTCGESAEPPLIGTVEMSDDRYAIWKHGERMRVETPDGRVRVIHDGERVLTFDEGNEVPLESGPGSFVLEDEDAAWNLLARPRLDRLELNERRADVVERGERFGRPTATLTLDHTYYDDFAMTLVLDAATGMPFEISEAGATVLRWLELEVVESIDETLLSWDGEATGGRWFAYVGIGDEDVSDDGLDGVPPRAREQLREQLREAGRRARRLAEELDLPAISADLPFTVDVGSFEPGFVTIDLEAGASVHVRGQRVADPDDDPGASAEWTTADGWTWTLHASGIDDERLFASVRDHVSAWRAERPVSQDD